MLIARVAPNGTARHASIDGVTRQPVVVVMTVVQNPTRRENSLDLRSSQARHGKSGIRPVAAPAYAPFVEGLRGLMALYVVLHHAALQAYDELYDGESLSAFAEGALLLCARGDTAVAVFIVLSGYCLMLPVAASGQLSGGVFSYLRRRARRILPAYYFSVLFVLCVVWAIPSLNEPLGTRWDLALPVDLAAVASHAFLIHNLHDSWIWKINGPLWSVATEWQIYLVFPLLVALWRRFGIGAVTCAGFVLGYGASLVLFASDSPITLQACPWYLSLFAIGMAVAVAARSGGRRAGWLGLAGVWLVAALALHTVVRGLDWSAKLGAWPGIVLDPLIAAAVGCLLLHCVRGPRGAHRGALVRVLEHPLLLQLGSFSYSLYLVHDPLISWTYRAMLNAGWGPEMRVWATFLVVVPLLLGCARCLYLVAERPFLPQRPSPTAVSI
jgi:peptidoglycan/LPS O-acetylase OafA/YrhL